MSNYDFSQPLVRKRSWKWENESIVDGHRVLPMSVADTDFISPREVTETFREIVEAEDFGYKTNPEDLPQVLAEWQQKQHGWALQAANVIIANGLLSSLALMLDVVSDPGEGVIIFTPVYQNFSQAITGAAREPRCCQLLCDENNYWNLDLQSFEVLCQMADTRAVIICNPHNPVGRAWSAEELRSLVRIAQANDVIVFSDEIHADFVFDQAFNPVIKVAENTQGIMALSSGGKIFNIGGLFSSYAMTEDDHLKAILQAALTRLHWIPDTFSAWGAYSAYKHGFEYRDEVVAYVRNMQIKLVDALNRGSFAVKATLPEATYLLWVDFRETGWSQDEIQRFLVEEAGLGFTRGDLYGSNGTGFVRINCAVSESHMDEAIQRLIRAFEKQR